MVKIHGDIMEMFCLSAHHLTRLDEPIDKDSIVDANSLPRCPQCGDTCRPNVVWFGEMLPPEPFSRAREFAARCDLFLIVGTSGTVSGGYGFAELARYAGATVIEVNPETSALSPLADISVRAPAAVALPEIFKKSS
jgi:NAD-dependent deacetylase